ncbi:HAMP domain-containing sensor histidine kinase [Cohnella sp. AR92]|uniref:sensor histidine kinase n=1 Tax=Cohnella sp. AR92 TaxID=648716 RepID=UPI000F8DCE42|nr:HAMP domain-containing sensor histidine kinase [Cohnella sp. AR92]RUS47320.1 sensor histidine kinase [Cohnella sp. AR92]
MNAIRLKAAALLVLVLVSFLAALPGIGHAKSAEAAESQASTISGWEIQWIGEDAPIEQSPSLTEPWHASNAKDPLIAIPEGSRGAWVHLTIPPTSDWSVPGLLIKQIYGLDLSVYENSRLIYHSERDFSFDRNVLLFALEKSSQPEDLYIRIESLDRAGPVRAAQIGEFNQLSESFTRGELPSILLGAAIAFLALLMLLISGYLDAQQRRAWITLSLIALTSSVLILTYSTLTFVIFKDFGSLLLFLFDSSMLVFFPALHFYVASVFDEIKPFYLKFGKWFAGYSAFCFVILILNEWMGDSFFFYYKLFTFWLLAPMILIHLVLVVSQSIAHSFRGNRDSLIVSLGLLSLAVAGIMDLMMIYTSETVPVFYRWKFGIVLLILALVIVLARKISSGHHKLIAYSRELELHNHQLQRTEKLKFVSELAASVAHEVRNPLQVTRGFLQLISSTSDQKNRDHFSMAINELDRASLIISDFLTFAKPELDTIAELNIHEELTIVETIMSPLAAINGAVFRMKVPENLLILGNPSKFKQAFMNLLKNSIEALNEDGIIEVEAAVENEKVLIRISDNGEGMDEEQIVRLGEPYYSTKSKGTGLGLMVTFRIIEVMKGTLEFRSVKGKGTEAFIRFPLVKAD